MRFSISMLKNAASWVSRLSETYEQLGLEKVSASHHPILPDLRAFFTHLQFMVSEEFSYSYLDNSGHEADGPKWRRLIAEASQESSSGVNLDFIIDVNVGRKPLPRPSLSHDVAADGSFHDGGNGGMVVSSQTWPQDLGSSH